jgi:hypothetical protein
MKSSNEIKKEPGENTRKVNVGKKSIEVKKKPDENKTQKPISATKTEKESKKSISRWDTDGGTDLCE